MSAVADITQLDISETTIPVESQDVSTCRVCGTGIDHLYSGKGRRPVVCLDHKTSGASKIGTAKGNARGNASAALAADSLDDAYAMVAMALFFFAPNASSVLAASREGQRAKNVAFLSKDPELCKMINKVGKSGGRFAFFASQGMLLAPVVMLAAGEIRERVAVEPTDDNASAAPFAEYAEPAE